MALKGSRFAEGAFEAAQVACRPRHQRRNLDLCTPELAVETAATHKHRRLEGEGGFGEWGEFGWLGLVCLENSLSRFRDFDFELMRLPYHL